MLLDYQVRIGDNCVLRAITPPGKANAAGDSVDVLIHPEHCVLVREN